MPMCPGVVARWLGRGCGVGRLRRAPCCPRGPSRRYRNYAESRGTSRAGGWWGTWEPEGAHRPHLSLHLGFGILTPCPPRGWEDRVSTGMDPGRCCGVQVVGCWLVEDLSDQRGQSVQAGPAWAKTGVSGFPPEKCPPAQLLPTHFRPPCWMPASVRGTDAWVW